MRHIVPMLGLLIGLSGTALAGHGNGSTVFPPADCSADEARIITWQDGSESTVCKSAQELFHLALPDCQDGEVIVFRNGESNPPGRDPVGAHHENHEWGKFVCEAKTGFGIAIDISVDVDFVAPSDGLLFVHVWAGPGDNPTRAPTYQVIMDGNLLTYVMAQDNYVTGTFSIIHNNLTYPVRKGQSVKVATVYAGAGAQIQFIALK